VNLRDTRGPSGPHEPRQPPVKVQESAPRPGAVTACTIAARSTHVRTHSPYNPAP
jgi:hypothetical protein